MDNKENEETPNLTSIASTNNSGSGDSTIVPDEIKGWSWGGFLWTWIWGIGNQVWISLLVLVPIPFVGLVMSIILGINGREWAWRKKHWESIESFKKTQRSWVKWWLIIMVPLMILSSLGIFLVAMLSAINPSEQIKRVTDTGIKNSSAQVLVAVERYYASNDSLPWNSLDKKSGDASYYSKNLVRESWLTELVTEDELSQSVITELQKNKSPIILFKEATVNGDIHICFKPESKTDKTLALQNCQNKVYKQTLSDYACASGNEMICIKNWE